MIVRWFISHNYINSLLKMFENFDGRHKFEYFSATKFAERVVSTISDNRSNSLSIVRAQQTIMMRLNIFIVRVTLADNSMHVTERGRMWPPRLPVTINFRARWNWRENCRERRGRWRARGWAGCGRATATGILITHSYTEYQCRLV